MNRVRVIVLVLMAALAAWIALRSCAPSPPAPPPPQPPPREVFHVSKALRVEVRHTASDGTVGVVHGWLERELRYLLARGKMRLAAVGVRSNSVPNTVTTPASGAEAQPYLLQLDINEATGDSQLNLIAPDDAKERSESFRLAWQSPLETMQVLAQRLPTFLGAPAVTPDWSTALGTSDAPAYDAFVRASDELLRPNAEGFTAPANAGSEAVLNLERVETLARRHRDFARARALLSLAYLSVGGRDQASLTKLAETAAERALAADPQLADAHAALGIVRLRRMDWSSAQEHFDAALALDVSSLPALEGLACLLVDVGHMKEALPIATRAARLQPGSRGASECETYALIAQDPKSPAPADPTLEVARIHAAMQLLGGDRARAEQLLRAGSGLRSELIDAVLAASATRERVPTALQVITRSADDEEIDARAEMLLGTALRRPDFVFNRMLRLAKQNEAVPLRLLWLPQTDFLRRHARFKEVLGAAALTTYWQDHGVADLCVAEPKVHGCAVKPGAR